MLYLWCPKTDVTIDNADVFVVMRNKFMWVFLSIDGSENYFMINKFYWSYIYIIQITCISYKYILSFR